MRKVWTAWAGMKREKRNAEGPEWKSERAGRTPYANQKNPLCINEQTRKGQAADWITIRKTN